MSISRYTYDPHSFARPEHARVVDIHLDLNVDFRRKILEGKAILTIERQSLINDIILDSYGLVIKRVTNFYNVESYLKYDIGSHGIFGSSFTIQLPPVVDYKRKCKIQIEYRTSRDSPALYWLTPKQTFNRLYPFLLTNNKLIYARAWFPCQDTPSVKFTYSAKIHVIQYFTVVLMSALLKKITTYWSCIGYKQVHEFHQSKPVPSYAVIIAVGFDLWRIELSERSAVIADIDFFKNSVKTFSSAVIESMLEIAESICGPYSWGRYDICVLPPSIAHLEIECPCVAFVSPGLLLGDHTSICSLARNISQSWAGNLVTCSNYEHLWLNKSFSIFISRKIISKMLIHENMKLFLVKEGLNNLRNMIKKFRNTGLLNCLLPSLTYLLPHKITKYVPYELGCILLNYLQCKLGSSEFESFLESYFKKFAFKSLNTKEWKDYLYQNFFNKNEILDGVPLDVWFYIIPAKRKLEVLRITAWDINLSKLAEDWVKCDHNRHSISSLLCREYINDAKEILFLNYLRCFHTSLTTEKLTLLLHFYDFDRKNAEIRLVWLLLCIEVRWAEKVESALKFAIEFCSPNYAIPIFQHLYEWVEMRPRVIYMYMKNYKKMLAKTQKELNRILELNS